MTAAAGHPSEYESMNSATIHEIWYCVIRTDRIQYSSTINRKLHKYFRK
jgi:hypothetical protein